MTSQTLTTFIEKVKCALSFNSMQENKDFFLLNIASWGSFAASLFTPDNISIVAGLSSICLSLTGVILNLIKILTERKNKNEKNS